MMNDKQRAQVYNILLTPIEFFSEKYKESIEYPDYKIEKTNIFIDKNVIKSTQSYYPYYPKSSKKRYHFSPDCDMSDFACGFYEIIYAPLLNGKKIVDEAGNFVDKEFAGDTMTSASKLPGLRDKYHCLANFWLLPMVIGRTSNNDWTKTSRRYDIQDFMDRFLSLLKANFGEYKCLYSSYFKNIDTFKRFVKIHHLDGAYVDEEYTVIQFSNNIDISTSNRLFELIKCRADNISKSEYADELWDYFNKWGLCK